MDEINHNSRIPLYLQLMDAVIEAIQSGEYSAGERLPSERELCDKYGVSRITVRQAMQELERENYIVKRHGKGTFVADKTDPQNLIHLFSFTEEMKRLGHEPTTRVIEFNKIAASERIARKLQVAENDPIYELVRLRLADDKEMMFERTYLSQAMFPELTKEQIEAKPMYDVFAGYGIVITRAVEEFKATLLQKDEAKLLNQSRNSAGMMINRFGYADQRLVEYTITIVSNQDFYYRIETTK
ncbi:GntR family transcriptional regulator [Listeria ilorinensis]|uniref:GntR family transcriptional regulator n=1 Tax=Listeria ilorinensis TaxID=2867439 RepID=UPI001EF6F62A|nr:GntR family transcriptional regulator [Listeria ilorinensis]